MLAEVTKVDEALERQQENTDMMLAKAKQ